MSISLTANEVVARALNVIGAIAQGETPDAAMSQQGRDLLTEMVDAWNIQGLTVLAQNRTVYDLVANQGSPTNPYTIGPGGDFDTGTAARPVAIRAANLLLNTTSPYPVEIPLAILTDQMYQSNTIKTLANAQPTTLYYQPSVPLGVIQLWPVPNTAANDLVLYTDLLTPQFVGATTAYVCPPGYAKAFRLCLADTLAPYYPVASEVRARIAQEAQEALRELKMNNAPMGDLAYDPMFVGTGHGTYVIQTDQGS